MNMELDVCPRPHASGSATFGFFIGGIAAALIYHKADSLPLQRVESTPMILLKSCHRGFYIHVSEKGVLEWSRNRSGCIRCTGGELGSFPVYSEYDQKPKEYYPAYIFEEPPEYTVEGRLFATADQESCRHCKPYLSGKPPPGD